MQHHAHTSGGLFLFHHNSGLIFHLEGNGWLHHVFLCRLNVKNCCCYSYCYYFYYNLHINWSFVPECWGAGVVMCLERSADLHMVLLMPLPLTVSCFSKIQIGFTFLALAHLGSPGKGPLNGCVCLCLHHNKPVVDSQSQKFNSPTGQVADSEIRSPTTMINSPSE